jgi:hypothetical protein
MLVEDKAGVVLRQSKRDISAHTQNSFLYFWHMKQRTADGIKISIFKINASCMDAAVNKVCCWGW